MISRVVFDVPHETDGKTVLRLPPKLFDHDFYAERTDRNIGWITKEEQEMIRHTTVGVAGCGGMGAQLAEKFLRLGVGEIRIADNEVFDVSNINRQFAAGRTTVGVSKALATARMLRDISEDSTIVMYPQGICEETVESFVSGCDVICDEVEFFAVGPRILLHQAARRAGVGIFNCNTVGFGTRLFLFTPQSVTIEEMFGLTLPEAMELSGALRSKEATPEMGKKVIDCVLGALVPELPSYVKGKKDLKHVLCRLAKGQASIIATNPPMATGFVADRVLFYLLRNSSTVRTVKPTPLVPGYLYVDVARMKARIVTGRKWWTR